MRTAIFRAAMAIFLAIAMLVSSPAEAGNAQAKYWLDRAESIHDDFAELTFRLKAVQADPSLGVFPIPTFYYLYEYELLAAMELSAQRVMVTQPGLKETFEAALKTCQQAARKADTSGTVFANLAHLYLLANRPDDARQAYMNGLQKDPRDKTLQNQLIIDIHTLGEGEGGKKLEATLRETLAGYSYPKDIEDIDPQYRHTEPNDYEQYLHLALAYLLVKQGCVECAANQFNEIPGGSRSLDVTHAFAKLKGWSDKNRTSMIYPLLRGINQQLGTVEKNADDAFLNQVYERNKEHYRLPDGTYKPFYDVVYAIQTDLWQRESSQDPAQRKHMQAALMDLAALYLDKESDLEAVRYTEAAKSLDVHYRLYERQVGGVLTPEKLEYAIGKYYLKKGYWGDAIRYLGVGSFNYEARKRADLLAMAGRDAAKQKDDKRARELIEGAIRLEPENPFWWRWLAQSASNDKDIVRVAQAWDNVFERIGYKIFGALEELAFEPDHLDYLDAGWAHLRLGNYGRARHYLGEGWRRFPQDTKLYFWYLVSTLADGQTSSISSLWSHRPSDPTDRRYSDAAAGGLVIAYDGLVHLGDKALEKRQHHLAFTHYTHALRAVSAIGDLRDTDPKWVDRQNTRVLGKMRQALPQLAFEPALPDDAIAAMQAGQRSAQSGQTLQAAGYFKKAAALAPWWGEAHYRYALALTATYGVSAQSRNALKMAAQVSEGPLAAKAQSKLQKWDTLMSAAKAQGATFRDDLPFVITPDRE